MALVLSVPDGELTETRAQEVFDTLGKAILLREEAAASPEAVDPIGTTLGKSDLPFEKMGAAYRLRVTLSGSKRAQVIVIRKEVWSYRSLKSQELSTPFYESAEPLSAALLEKVAQKSLPLGGILLDPPDQERKTWRLRYRIEVPADSSLEELKYYILLAGNVGGDLVKEFSSDVADASASPKTTPPPKPAVEMEALANKNLKAALDVAGLKYVVLAEGRGYSVTVASKDGRQQTVSISLASTQHGDVLTHHLSTTVWTGATPPDSALLRGVMGKVSKFGRFSLVQSAKGAWEIRFGITLNVLRFPDGTQLSKTLQDAVSLVGLYGEQTYKELNDKQDTR